MATKRLLVTGDGENNGDGGASDSLATRVNRMQTQLTITITVSIVIIMFLITLRDGYLLHKFIIFLNNKLTMSSALLLLLFGQLLISQRMVSIEAPADEKEEKSLDVSGCNGNVFLLFLRATV